VKSCVGVLKLKTKQAQRLGLKPRTQLSPLLEKCCLRLAANESYQSAEAEIEALMGVKVGHTTHQRLVQRQDLPLPEALQAVSEVSVDESHPKIKSSPNNNTRIHWFHRSLKEGWT
jgi:hypothetical protein